MVSGCNVPPDSEEIKLGSRTKNFFVGKEKSFSSIIIQQIQRFDKIKYVGIFE